MLQPYFILQATVKQKCFVCFFACFFACFFFLSSRQNRFVKMLQPYFILQAFAEELHERIRKELWGYSCRENMEANDLHKIKYQVHIEPWCEKTCLWDFRPGLT